MYRILVFDTETTGLPVTYDASIMDVHNWPRIIQLSWELCWSNGDTIKKVTELVKPDGWQVPDKAYWLAKGNTEQQANEKGKFWYDNGYTTIENTLRGKPMAELLREFIQALNSADVLVAHNMTYDRPIITCEMFRYGLSPTKERNEHPYGLREGALKDYCTQIGSTPVLKIPGHKGTYKWPTLDEAYRFFFKEGFEGAHSADNDVEACKQVYLKLMELEDV